MDLRFTFLLLTLLALMALFLEPGYSTEISQVVTTPIV